MGIIQDRAIAVGRVLVEIHDATTGELVRSWDQNNIVTNVGLDLFATLITGDSTSYPSHMAIGTGSTAAAATDTALVAEVDRNAFASETTASTGVITWKGFWNSSEANGNTIAEAGVFNDASAGTMSNRVVLSSTVAKTSSISLTVTWTFTLTDNS